MIRALQGQALRAENCQLKSPPPKSMWARRLGKSARAPSVSPALTLTAPRMSAALTQVLVLFDWRDSGA